MKTKSKEEDLKSLIFAIYLTCKYEFIASGSKERFIVALMRLIKEEMFNIGGWLLEEE